MAFKLAISAGHYLHTSGKRCLKSLDPKETREWWLNDRIADKIEKLLSEYDGIEILRLDDTTGQKAIELSDRANASNNFGADFYLSIHHNAGIAGGNGGGIVAYIYNGSVKSATPQWQKELYNELIKLTGLKGNRSSPLARSNLYECRVPKAPAVLLELGFMDSATDVPIILSEDYANKCAQACVNVIVRRANLTKKSVDVKEEVKKLYRVRKTWADVKSQKGAFSSLDNAKECCQTSGVGYKVFDWNGKEVYSYMANVVTPPQEDKKEQPKQETVKKAVYELDFPTQTKIVDKSKTCADDEVVKAIKYILANNPNFDIEIAKAFFKISSNYGIDPTMAISQSILETGWFKYQGSAVKPEHHNYCGLGVTSNGIEGGKFDTIEDGVTAQLQHLFAYGCKDTLDEDIIDPRFKYVTRGIAPYWEQLAGRWAVPGYEGTDPEASIKAGTTYGQKILKVRNGLLATTITDEDVKKYFPTQDDKKEVEPTPVEPETDDEKVDNIVNIIIKVLSKLFVKLAEIFSKK